MENKDRKFKQRPHHDVRGRSTAIQNFANGTHLHDTFCVVFLDRGGWGQYLKVQKLCSYKLISARFKKKTVLGHGA